jgi:hypothetical protein
MSNRGSKLIRSNVFLTVAEREGFKALARKRRISAAFLIRQVLDAFLGIKSAPVEPIMWKNNPPGRPTEH